MAGELSFREAVDVVRQRLNASIGRAEAIVKRALASGEVRKKPGPILLTADDGIMGMRPGGEHPRYNKDDLLDWLNRQHVQTKHSIQSRKQPKRDRAKQAIDALWPCGPPDATVLPNGFLCKEVIKWLEADCKSRHIPFDRPGDDSILRAAGRK